MLAKSSLIVLFSFVGLASAGGIGNTNWGCSSSLKQSASTQQKSACSGSGSFFTEFGGKAICCSSQTRTTPSGGTVCPLNWSQHKTAKCCIPPVEVTPGDCGEGYTWGGNSKTCSGNTSPKCSSSQWYHDRSGSCCDNSWANNPPAGSCPSGKSCPTDWFWHATEKCCKPKHKRSPAPDCDDWDDKNQCCGSSNPQPSGKSTGGGHGGSGGNGGGHKGQWSGYHQWQGSKGGKSGGGGGGGGDQGGRGGEGGRGGQWGSKEGGGQSSGGGEKKSNGAGWGGSGSKGGQPCDEDKGGKGGGHKRDSSIIQDREETRRDQANKPQGWKRDFLGRQQNVLDVITFPQSPLDKMYCPKGLHACSVITQSGGEWAYECIDFTSELESCGGCASTGEGQDCSKIPHALSMGCEGGSCVVYTCKSGFQPNGTSCIAA